ncbi:MAG: HNH endonuclease [Candidatus Dormibacteraeota bacterium]|nr:HNH endonuclease [Candidatus Dormibacteraeota bacterium]
MLAAQDVCALDAIDLVEPDLGERLIRKRHVIDLMELSFAQEAAEFAATLDYEEDGSATPIDWIRINCHMTGNVAADRVAVGDLLPRLGQSIDALVEGEVGFAHLTVMARTANAVGKDFNETALLTKARENSPGKFHHICRHYRHALDPKGYAAEQNELVENRRLSLSTWDDGSLLLNGVLDPVGGAALRTALEPLARRSGAHDDRNRERRLADALVELATGGEQVAHIQVTSSLETLLGLPGAPAAEMEFSLPVSSKTVERLACDCSITRVLLDSESMVIDVGRAKRVVSGPGRRALKARDGSCRWPGCDRPASWSAAHHVVHWIHGGTTDLNNLILLCHRHHWMVHEGNWQLVRTDEGRLLPIPPTVTFGASARGPD